MKNLISYQPKQSSITYIILGILAFCFLLHIQIIPLDFQGKHAWRQTQTMWNIKNFVESDSNILNPRVSHYNHNDTNIQRYEFPIMQWTIGMVQRALGQHPSIVRIMLFLICAWASIGFYRLLRRMEFEALPALSGFTLFLFSPVMFYYMINPIPDNLALGASMWYLYYTLSYYRGGKHSYIILAAFCLLLATWAKLPYLMLSIVGIFFFFKKIIKDKSQLIPQIKVAVQQLIIILPALIWYYYVIPTWTGNDVLTGVFGTKTDWVRNYEILKFHANTMFPQILLYASVWIPFMIGMIASFKRLQNDKWVWWMFCMCTVYLLLQWDVIGTVHDYYLMPFLPALYIFVTVGIEKLLSIRFKWSKLIAMLCIISAPFVSYYVTIDKWYTIWYNKDLYTHRTALSNAVPNDAKCIILNDVSMYVFPYQVNKKGYIYNGSGLPADIVNDLIKTKGTEYLYSDSRKFDQREDIIPMLDSLILEAGSIKVFSLKSVE